jgi:hypothetical protein
MRWSCLAQSISKPGDPLLCESGLSPWTCIRVRIVLLHLARNYVSTACPARTLLLLPVKESHGIQVSHDSLADRRQGFAASDAPSQDCVVVAPARELMRRRDEEPMGLQKYKCRVGSRSSHGPGERQVAVAHIKEAQTLRQGRSGEGSRQEKTFLSGPPFQQSILGDCCGGIWTPVPEADGRICISVPECDGIEDMKRWGEDVAFVMYSWLDWMAVFRLVSSRCHDRLDRLTNILDGRLVSYFRRLDLDSPMWYNPALMALHENRIETRSPPLECREPVIAYINPPSIRPRIIRLSPIRLHLKRRARQYTANARLTFHTHKDHWILTQHSQTHPRIRKFRRNDHCRREQWR